MASSHMTAGALGAEGVVRKRSAMTIREGYPLWQETETARARMGEIRAQA